MKKKVLMILMLVMIFGISTDVYAASINKKSVVITKTKTYKLKLKGTKIKAVSSTNKKIATVKKSGEVKAVGKGSCSVYLRGTNGVRYKCKVKVEAPKLNKKSITLALGKKFDVDLPGSSKQKTWHTENKSIASIDGWGVVKGKKVGTTNIYVKCDGLKYKCKVKVNNPRINTKNKTIHIGKTYQLELYDAKLSKTKTSNSKIATVDKNGLVKGVSEGFCNITLTDTEKRTYKCKIVVVKGPSKSNLEGKKISIIGDSISTFKDRIPKGYKIYYPKGEVNMNNQTWWRRLIIESKMTLVNNCSWSGSKVVGNASSTSSAKAACSTKRIMDLSKDGKKPDLIVIYMGINDYLKMTPMGNWLKCRNAIKDSSKVETFTEAYALMLQKIQKYYPDAKVYCCTLLPVTKKRTVITANINSAGVNLDVYNTAIRNIANAHGVNLIDLNKNGYGISRCIVYTMDELHPNDKGHIFIKNMVRTSLINSIK